MTVATHYKNLSKKLQNTNWPGLVKWVWHGLASGFGGRRLPRYFWLSLGGVTAIWLFAGIYLIATPRTYQGEFTLILPGAGAGATINLDAIGQASSLSESAFSNTRVNPTESYKRLMLSDRVIDVAKEQANANWFPRPRVKLLDQTQFIEVSVNGKSPEEAKRRADALNNAFLNEVSNLRVEERASREQGYQKMVSEFERNVSQARSQLLKHQSKSGLASIEQYNERVAVVGNLQVELNASGITEQEARRRYKSLLSIMNLTETDAANALTFAADPVFTSLAATHAEIGTTLAQLSYKLGQNHPQRVSIQRQYEGVSGELVRRGAALGAKKTAMTYSIAQKITGANYAQILKEVVAANVAYETASQRSISLRETLESEKASLGALAQDAATLEDLDRALQVAEAVFRSAIARIDTTKGDLYASYPLIQTVEAPSLPEKPSSPIPMLGIVGAFVASFLYLMGVALICLRQPLLRALLKRS